MSLPPVLQYELGLQHSADLSSGRVFARTITARGSAMAAVRGHIGRMMVVVGRRIMGDPAATSMATSEIKLSPIVK